jgi:hypothetical protein
VEVFSATNLVVKLIFLEHCKTTHVDILHDTYLKVIEKRANMMAGFEITQPISLMKSRYFQCSDVCLLSVNFKWVCLHSSSIPFVDSF